MPTRSATVDNVLDDEDLEDYLELYGHHPDGVGPGGHGSRGAGVYCGGPHRLDGRFKPKTLPHSSASDPVPVPSCTGGEPGTSKLIFSTSAAVRSESTSGAGGGSSGFGLMESPPEFPISERPVDVGWVGGWASDFDILLSDPIGVKAFTVSIRILNHYLAPCFPFPCLSAFFLT